MYIHYLSYYVLLNDLVYVYSLQVNISKILGKNLSCDKLSLLNKNLSVLLLTNIYSKITTF